MSSLLVWINVIFIYLTAVLVFKFKRVDEFQLIRNIDETRRKSNEEIYDETIKTSTGRGGITLKDESELSRSNVSLDGEIQSIGARSPQRDVL